MSEASQVELPPGVTGDFQVYVNGVPQQPGVHYRQEGSTLVFSRPLEPEGRLGFWRWCSIVLGVAGTYRRNDTVDVVYGVDGQRRVATLQPQPLQNDPD